MKKLFKLALLVFIPIICGVILIVVGNSSADEALISAGIYTLSIGSFVVTFAVVVIGIVLIIIGKIDISDYRRGKNSPDLDESKSRSKREKAAIAEVNSTRGRESRRLQSEFVANHAAENYRNSTPKQKLFGWLFFGFLMLDFALIAVFSFLGIWIGAIVCFCLFGGTLIVALITVKLNEKLSLRGNRRKKRGAASKTLCGRVEACLLSSSTSTGGGKNGTTRITGVTYRVIIASDGMTYTAYSEKFFEKGEPVVFEVLSRRRAHIVI